MADVEVKKQDRPQQGGLTRRSEVNPSLFGPGEIWGMSPFSTNPFRMMQRMIDDFDRMTGTMIRSGGSGASESSGWWPAIEVAQEAGKLNVCAELPGLKPEDVKVEVTDEGLIIRGERKESREDKQRGYYRSERSYGQFQRMIPLPEGVKADEAHAEFHNGELRISIPVPEAQHNKREIPISTEAKAPQKTGGAGAR